MTDNSAPDIFTQPDSDADDVLGHRTMRDSAPDAHRAQDEEDDVEGHRTVRDRVAAHDDEDDVEGHRKA